MTDKREDEGQSPLETPSDKPPPSLGMIGLNAFVPYLLNRISTRWNADLREELRRRDLTTPKLRALAVLSVQSPMTINDLCVYAVMEQSTMSRTVDALEVDGLITRTIRAEDMRVREIMITDQGRQLFEAFWPTMHASYSHMIGGIDESEMRQFTITLQKMLANIRRHEI